MRLILFLSLCLLISGCSNSPGDVAILDDSPAGDAGGPPDEVGGPDLGSGPSNAPQDAAAMTPVAIAGGVATLSAENTKIQFVGTHEPPRNEPRTGVFTEFSGEVEVDVDSKTLKAVSVEIKTESLITAIERLTNHLRSPDFFSARDYPVAKFESTSIEPGDEYMVSGNLTLLETTKEVSFPATVTIDDTGITLSGELALDRTDFGMVGVETAAKEVALTVVIGQTSELPASGGGGLSGGGGGRGRGGRGGQGGRDPAAMFAQLDANSDGKVAGDEIPSWMTNNMDAFDGNGDGAITQEEMAARFAQFRQGGGGGGGGGRGGRGGGRGGGGFDPTMMFANMDADQDGKLAGDEIPERMRENLAETDTDGDGAISLAELEERFRQFRGRGGRGGGRGGRGGGPDNRPERPRRPETENSATEDEE